MYINGLQTDFFISQILTVLYKCFCAFTCSSLKLPGSNIITPFCITKTETEEVIHSMMRC